MLNEDPRPDDLPDGADGVCRPAARLRAARPAVPAGPAGSGASGGSGGPAGRSQEPFVAAVRCSRLVAVVAVAAAVGPRRLALGSPTPAAQPRIPATVESAPGDPEPVDR